MGLCDMTCFNLISWFIILNKFSGNFCQKHELNVQYRVKWLQDTYLKKLSYFLNMSAFIKYANTYFLFQHSYLNHSIKKSSFSNEWDKQYYFCRKLSFNTTFKIIVFKNLKHKILHLTYKKSTKISPKLIVDTNIFSMFPVPIQFHINITVNRTCWQAISINSFSQEMKDRSYHIYLRRILVLCPLPHYENNSKSLC